MKKLILTILAATALLSAQAQFFSPEAANGAFAGALAGGIFGGRHPGQAIAIGAASGLFLGSVAHAVNRERYGYSYYSGYPYYGYGSYAYRRPSAYAYCAPFYTSYSCAVPAYYPTYAPAPTPVMIQPLAPPAPEVQAAQPQPAYNSGSRMSAANTLFGR